MFDKLSTMDSPIRSCDYHEVLKNFGLVLFLLIKPIILLNISTIDLKIKPISMILVSSLIVEQNLEILM